jgi:hypothetical protein
MADDGDKARSVSGLIALLLLAASAVVVKQLPYSSARPEGTDKAAVTAASPQDVVARLWQDPFGAVEQHQRDESRAQPPCCGIPPGPAHHTPETLSAGIPRDGRPVIVMPVFTFGGPYAEDAENRRRLRYAVLSALGFTAHTVDDNRRIGFVNVATPPLTVVPYELLTRFEGPGRAPRPAAHVVVLWVDEEAKWRLPLAQLATLLETLRLCQRTLAQNGQHRAVLKIIGPQTAHLTLDVKRELFLSRARGSDDKCYEEAEFYTLSTAEQLSDIAEEALRLPNALSKRLAPLRAIQPDLALLPVIDAELRRRGVRAEHDRIILIGEWDTGYARQLLGAAFDQFCMQSPGSCRHGYTYLRGLDGFVAASAPKTETAPGDSGAGSPSIGRGEPPRRRERSEGNAQLDYLRRLAGYIEDSEALSGTRRPVKAIGVLGSDVYDKLLIMQALRDAHSEAIFFTTDLDARLLDPGEFRWARNLVVVSSFGLQLGDIWQGAIPPFRDSYQTAQFFAVQLAFRDQWGPGRFNGLRVLADWPEPARLTQDDLDRALTIRTFEIGRTAAMDLSPANSDLHPRPTGGVPVAGLRMDGWRLFWALVALGLGAMLTVLASLRVRSELRGVPAFFDERPRTAWGLTLGGIVAILAVGVPLQSAVLLERDGGGEPFAWFEGVSLWPTEVLRGIAVATALILIVAVARRLKRLSRTLGGEFFEAIATEPAATGRRRRSFGSLFGLSMHDDDDTADIETETLWRRYGYLTAPRQRFWRLLLLVVLFDGIALVILHGVFVSPFVPYRGNLSLMVDRGVLTCAVAAVSVLLFSVTDAIWLCLRFTRELGRPVATKWPEEILARELKLYRLPPEVLAAWLDVRFVAQWTRELLGIVYYPAVVICLMILARSSVFDRWEPLPLGLTIVVVVGLGFLATCAISLRRMAERVRANTRETLLQCLLRSQAPAPRPLVPAPADEAGATDQLKSLLAEVEKLSDGAFAPLAQQPFLKAALLPLSGAGGLAAIEFLLLGH